MITKVEIVINGNKQCVWAVSVDMATKQVEQWKAEGKVKPTDAVKLVVTQEIKIQ